VTERRGGRYIAEIGLARRSRGYDVSPLLIQEVSVKYSESGRGINSLSRPEYCADMTYDRAATIVWDSKADSFLIKAPGVVLTPIPGQVYFYDKLNSTIIKLDHDIYIENMLFVDRDAFRGIINGLIDHQMEANEPGK
jgi:hypothetical protein